MARRRRLAQDFAEGAVIQHFTKSPARAQGIDFSLPTDAELDAMEAFQLSLGRQDGSRHRASLFFTTPIVEDGQALFKSAPTRNGTGSCVSATTTPARDRVREA